MVLPSGAVQLSPLNSTYSNLHSGPILILDQTTLYITSLHYDGKLSEVYFQAFINASTLPVLLLLNENNFANELHAHWGQNIYLKLPNNLTIYNIVYIRVWSKKTEEVYATIVVPNNIIVPEKTITEQDVSSRI